VTVSTSTGSSRAKRPARSSATEGTNSGCQRP